MADLSAKGVKVTGAVVDIADKEAYQGWVASAGEELGGIDIFIPNVSAGGGNMSEEGWEANFNIDLLGTTRGVEAAMPFLEKSSSASIVVISSTAGVETFMGPQPYNAIKGALVIHAKQLSQALAPAGIRVNCVSPGPIYIEGGAWEFIKNNMAELYDSTLASIPRGSMGSAEEVANAVEYMVGDEPTWVASVGTVWRRFGTDPDMLIAAPT